MKKALLITLVLALTALGLTVAAAVWACGVRFEYKHKETSL